MSRLTLIVLLLALGFVAAITACDSVRRHPTRFPWTPLSLSAPIGPFTGTKLAMLADDAPQCQRLLVEAGVSFTPLPPVSRPQCGYADAVMLGPGGALPTRWQPGGLAVACPVAAALLVWEREVVRPAALRHFGKPVEAIEHFGSFSCRRIEGSSGWSEHATADAIDIAGFRLRGGGRVRVRGDWNGQPKDAAFLHEVRDGACRVFATVLSPDYNDAHADHLHFDQAARGKMGRQFCR